MIEDEICLWYIIPKNECENYNLVKNKKMQAIKMTINGKEYVIKHM